MKKNRIIECICETCFTEFAVEVPRDDVWLAIEISQQLHNQLRPDCVAKNQVPYDEKRHGGSKSSQHT